MIFKTYKERRRLEARDGQPELYTYDQAPEHMRHQICMALSEGIGRYHRFTGNEFRSPPSANDTWEEIDRICTKELASYLSYTQQWDLARRFLTYVSSVPDIEDFLSAVEIGCVALSMFRDDPPGSTDERGAKQAAADALREINSRFEQHGVGYQFENGEIIRIDSKLVHAEIIKPVLQLLTFPAFRVANEDFMSAHRHYREGQFKDAVTSANRAFESMLKAICDVESWQYSKGDRATELVTLVRNKGLFTHSFDKSFDTYIAMLKTGLPSVRNDAGGHGDGLAAAKATRRGG